MSDYIEVEYKQTFSFEKAELLAQNPDLDFKDDVAVLEAVECQLEEYDFNERANKYISLVKPLKREDVVRWLKDNDIEVAVYGGDQMYARDEVLADPVVWLREDLESLNESVAGEHPRGPIDIEAWFDGSCPKTLRDRSTEIGWELIEDIVPRRDDKEADRV